MNAAVAFVNCEYAFRRCILQFHDLTRLAETLVLAYNEVNEYVACVIVDEGVRASLWPLLLWFNIVKLQLDDGTVHVGY